MVVMELLEGAVTWQSSMLLTTDKILLQEAIKKLHGAVWVHGDIRTIMCSSSYSPMAAGYSWWTLTGLAARGRPGTLTS